MLRDGWVAITSSQRSIRMPSYVFTCSLCEARSRMTLPMAESSPTNIMCRECGTIGMRRVYGDGVSMATATMHAEGGQSWREFKREVEDGARARGDEIKCLDRAELV